MSSACAYRRARRTRALCLGITSIGIIAPGSVPQVHCWDLPTELCQLSNHCGGHCQHCSVACSGRGTQPALRDCMLHILPCQHECGQVVHMGGRCGLCLFDGCGHRARAPCILGGWCGGTATCSRGKQRSPLSTACNTAACNHNEQIMRCAGQLVAVASYVESPYAAIAEKAVPGWCISLGW